MAQYVDEQRRSGLSASGDRTTSDRFLGVPYCTGATNAPRERPLGEHPRDKLVSEVAFEWTNGPRPERRLRCSYRYRERSGGTWLPNENQLARDELG